MAVRSTTGALAGVRVLDFGHYIAGPLAAMLLAEQGADVVHVSPPGAERWRDSSNAFLQRMKQVVTLDLRSATGKRAAVDLARGADVIIDNFRPGVLGRLGVMPSAAADARIWLSLPGFATADRRASLRAWEGIVGAAAGLFTDVHVARQFLGLPPVFTALPLASVYGAVHGATAIAAALLRRTHTGAGTRIEVPLADALFHAMGTIVMKVPAQPARYDIPPVPRVLSQLAMPWVRALVRATGDAGQRSASAVAARMIPPLMNNYRGSDERLLYVFAMDHAAMPRRLAEVTGIVALLERSGFVFASPFDDATIGRNLCDAARLTRARRSLLRELLQDAFATRTAFEWERVLNEAGVPAAVQRSTSEWMAWELVRTAGLVVRLDDPQLGSTDMPGRSVCIGTEHAAPALTPRVYCDAQSVTARWASLPDRSSEARASDAAVELPLTGMTVVDLSSMIAGPVAARTLAQYGARVWKVEPSAPHHGPRMNRWYGIDVNQGKDSIVLDLKSDPGQTTLRSLLAQSHVVIHNLRDAAACACGLGDDDLRAFPRLVVASLSAYRGSVPAAFDCWPGYDPVLQATSGIMTRYGSAAQPELHALASCVDYLSGDLLAFGAITALFARAEKPNERPPAVRSSLAQGAQLAQTTLLLRHAGRDFAGPEGQAALGRSGTDRIFPTRDGFVYCVVPTDALSRLCVDEAALGPLLRSRSSAQVVSLLIDAGASAHEVISLAHTSFESVDARGVDLRTRGSLLTWTGPHPAGGRVTTVFPASVRAEPVLTSALAPAMPRGAAHPALRELIGKAAALGAEPTPAVEPYLPT